MADWKRIEIDKYGITISGAVYFEWVKRGGRGYHLQLKQHWWNMIPEFERWQGIYLQIGEWGGHIGIRNKLPLKYHIGRGGGSECG